MCSKNVEEIDEKDELCEMVDIAAAVSMLDDRECRPSDEESLRRLFLVKFSSVASRDWKDSEREDSNACSHFEGDCNFTLSSCLQI
jgi:hypothetical protein